MTAPVESGVVPMLLVDPVGSRDLPSQPDDEEALPSSP
jgi:hypothetical protein